MAGLCLGRMRFVGFVKGVLMFCLGFCTRSMLDLAIPGSFPSECPMCANYDLAAEQELLKQDIHTQLREPFKPKTIYEVLRYDYFNMSAIMNNFDDNPKTNLLGHQKGNIKDILQQAMVLYNTGGKTWKLNKLINGYSRVDPLRGEEFILDLLMDTVVKKQDKEEIVTETHRLEMVKPFSTAQLVSDNLVRSKDKMIHFILPVTAMNIKLEEFLASFTQVCTAVDNAEVYMIVMMFVNQSATNRAQTEARVKHIKEMTANISRHHRNAHISVIQTKKPFSRSLGIDLGVKQLPNNALMFFCDIDVHVTTGFLSRCRQNSILNKQVYYPMVFAQYDPKIVQKYSPIEKYHHLFNINKYTGHWVHYGYGMACMYAGDYRAVGGLDLKIKGWGGEDVDLYKKHVKSKLKVFRAADPGLVHVYHPKFCDPTLSPDQQRMCLDSQAEGRGSKQQLGKMLQELTRSVDL